MMMIIIIIIISIHLQAMEDSIDPTGQRQVEALKREFLAGEACSQLDIDVCCMRITHMPYDMPFEIYVLYNINYIYNSID